MSAPAARRRVVAVRGGERRTLRDRLAGEEPMEIRVTGPDGTTDAVAVTMRTPGDDFELAAGFLVTEGVVAARVDPQGRVLRRRGPRGPALQRGHRPQRRPGDARRDRAHAMTTASCGICGITSLDDRRGALRPAAGRPGGRAATPSGRCRTGCGRRSWCSTPPVACTPRGSSTPDGRLLLAREDIGRHNAVDKVVGAAAAGRRPAPARPGPHGLRAGELRDRPEGRGGGDSGAGGGVGPLEPGGRCGGAARA